MTEEHKIRHISQVMIAIRSNFFFNFVLFGMKLPLFQEAVTIQQIAKPTSKDFVAIVETIYEAVAPQYELKDKKLVEEVTAKCLSNRFFRLPE